MIRDTETIDGRQYTRLNADGNGNSRTVISWLGWGFATYGEACAAFRQLGGRRYHCKAFGGGIVFQAKPGSLAELLRGHGHIKSEVES